MTRVNTQVARKDYPESGIKKGDTYYSWTPGFRGTLRRSKTYPRRSQLTANDKLCSVYSIEENLQDQLPHCKTPEDIIDLLDTSFADVESVTEEYRDSYDNLPEGLQQADVGCQLEENAENLEAWAGELEELIEEVKSANAVDVVNEHRGLTDGEEGAVAAGTEFDDMVEADREIVMDHLRNMVAENQSCPL